SQKLARYHFPSRAADDERRLQIQWQAIERLLRTKLRHGQRDVGAVDSRACRCKVSMSGMEQGNAVRPGCISRENAVGFLVLERCGLSRDHRGEVGQSRQIIVDERTAADGDACAKFPSPDLLGILADGAVFDLATLVDLLESREVADAQELVILEVRERL